MIKISGLSKNFAEKRAVQDVSFTVGDGEIFALLGPNGAGKTTTMRMLSTLLGPTGGEVSMDGLDIRKDAKEIRQRIGFLTTEIRLDGQFTPNELAAFYGRLYGLDAETLAGNRRKLFDYFGITQIADKKYETFSTGMKQKTSIAICLIHDPKIIIFDEPTNGLDILTQKQVEDFLLMEKARNKSIILSTHILEVVETLADRVGVIIDGKSVAEGTIEEIVMHAGAENLRGAFLALYGQNHEKECALLDKKQKKTGIFFKRR